MIEQLSGKKTYIFAVLSVIAGFYLLSTGQIDGGQFIVILETALIGTGIRLGVAKTNE
tara:strand:- start:2117 stop:2290 length:174 start_codon:yes stop_codon:yes gene_type:complete